jgi:predicted XRE-type DNA-binding protein
MKNGSRTKKPKRTIRTTPIKVEASSGNVFADLGHSRPEEALAKAELVSRISDIISRRKLTQTKASALLGIDQPKVSALLRGKLEGFSTDRLFLFLNRLGQDVEIVIKPFHRRATGEATTRVVGQRIFHRAAIGSAP